MKKRLTIGIAVVALAATVTSLTAAGLRYRERAAAVDEAPTHALAKSVRSLGLKPSGQALRRGPYYVLNATNPRGAEVRVVADAQFGDIISVAPIAAPHYGAGARIIHVPQPRARGEQANSYQYDEAAVPADGDDEDVAPPPRRRPIQRSQRSDPPPPPPPPRVRSEPKRVLGPPRNVLGAPQPATELTPIYPTPKFDAKPYSGDKFAAPEANAATMAPPPGYMPPRAPRDEN